MFRVYVGHPSLFNEKILVMQCKEKINNLADRIYKTKDARFNAAKRMARSGKASKACEALLSASIIGISLIAMQMDDVHIVRLISGMTIVLSTFVLVFSLLLGYLAYDRRYDNYHRCGQELARIYHELDNLCCENLPEEECHKVLDNFTNRYEEIVKTYNLNHIEIDYLYGLSTNSHFSMSRFCKFVKWCRFNVFDVYMLYWLLAIVPIGAIVYYYVMEMLK